MFDRWLIVKYYNVNCRWRHTLFMVSTMRNWNNTKRIWCSWFL